MAPGTNSVAPTRPQPESPQGGASRTRLAASIAAALLIVVAVVVAMIAGGRGDDSAPDTTSAGYVVGQEPSLGGSAVPAEIDVDGTTGLKDGSEIRIRVTSQNEIEIFGFEAFLCAAGATFVLDADVRPDDTGNCASKPLSAGSDRYKQVKGQAPYQVVESTFRAGVGTDTYVTSEGTPVTITCGPAHPCQLVLKVQYPKGYGFRAFQLDYA